jgi:sodium/hydrogen exchanger-like protein 6/7
MGFAALGHAGFQLLRRDGDTETDPEGGNTPQNEILQSWALFISIMLLIVAFFTSYMLQQKKVTAIHETAISIFAGMTVGLILVMTSKDTMRSIMSFNPGIFFNLLLPPIILSSGYELHQANFFRNIGTILTFAFAGTFLSAVVIGVILFLFNILPGSLALTFVDCLSVGATLSATDPVTILAIFNSYKVDPKLYTIIFGESILNDAVAIVIFETAQKYKSGESSSLGILSFFEGVGIFLLDFFGSLVIGVLVGVGTALLLKFTYIRRYTKIESCLVVLLAYSTYFFSQAIHLSGIVSLLFCGITLKHYAYFNMSRRTQLTTKYLFQVLAQLSENFIFIYLGLALFSDNSQSFQPPLIIVTMLAVCAARWVAVFPLSHAINWFIKVRARRRGLPEPEDELPYSYQAMIFWAGLRGAVGVALAALMQGEHLFEMKATVLVVVVLTVIIFGGTTARMLEILGIRTGVVDEVDSDDEFDIEPISGAGQYYKRSSGGGIGYTPRRGTSGAAVSLGALDSRRSRRNQDDYASGNTTSLGTGHRPSNMNRRNSQPPTPSADDIERADLLGRSDSDLGSDIDTSDLPPPARRDPSRRASPMGHHPGDTSMPGGAVADVGAGAIIADTSTTTATAGTHHVSATSAFRQLFSTEDPAGLFRQLDEDFIKPTLLLDSGAGRGGQGSHSGGGSGGV